MRWWITVVALAACGAPPGELGPSDPAPEPEPSVTPDPDPGGSGLEPVAVGFALDEPPHGSWLEPGPLTVRGTAPDFEEVVVAGTTVAVADGGFEAQVEAPAGVLEVVASAVDAHGFTHVRRTSALAGDFADPYAPVAGAMHMRANQGGLDLALAELPSLLDDEIVEAELLLDPLLYESWSVDLYLESLSYEAPTLAIELHEGSMSLDFRLTELTGTMWYDSLWDGDGTLSASELVLTADLALAVEEGQALATVSNAAVSMTDFYFDLEYSLGIEHLLQDLVQDAVEAVMADLLVTEGGPLIEDEIEALDMSYEEILLDVPFAISATLADLSIDPAGIQAVADVSVTVEGAPESTVWPWEGYPSVPSEIPVLSKDDDLAFFVTDDVLNLVLFHAWEANLLNDALSTAEGTLSAVFLAAAGATDGTMAVDALNPPVVMGAGDDVFELQFACMRLDVQTPGAPLGDALELDFSARIPFTPALAGNLVTLDLGAVSTSTHVRADDWMIRDEEIIALVGGAVPVELVTDLAADLVIELPTIEGYAVAGGTVARTGNGTLVGLDLD